MRFLEQLAAATAFTTIVSAHPTLPKRGAAVVGSSKFTVKQGAPKTPGRKLAGPIALANALGKYHKIGGTAPPVVKAAAAKAAATDDGTVTANPQQYDAEYLESVSVGGQTLNLDFDTGSSDLWVFSNELPSNDQSGHNIYTPGSSANKLSGETWSISYGDGSSASGDVYTDSVDVGGTTVTAQAVELASSISAQFVQDPSDGLLGLGFSSINTITPDQQKTFFDNAQSGLAAPLFTANLVKGAPGSYNFGYIDDTEHTGSVTYVSVDNSKGFWGYTTDSYTVGSGSAVTGSVSSIADTGTSLLLTDDNIVSAYYAQVSSATNSQTDGGYVFDCSATLPDISFGIGGYTATVPGSYMNYAPASAAGTCFGGIQSNAGIGFSIFGDIFLKSQFVVFSANGPQLGFAPKNV